MAAGRRRRWGGLFGPDPARDVDDEIEFHLEMRVRERVEAGEPPDVARERVMRRFGDVASAREQCITITERRGRSMRRVNIASELVQDAGHALRSLRRRPGFAAVALLTLALGIGANTAIFSVVNGVLLESLPYADADELVVVRTEYSNGSAYELSAPDFMSVRQDNRVFTEVGALAGQMVTLTGRGEPREVLASYVSRELFSLLGIAPQAGRTFEAGEHVPGATTVTVLTAGLARALFGDAAAALGQSLTLAGSTYTVVGVMPAGTEAPEQTELYIPLAYDERYDATTTQARRSEFLVVIGRTRDGVSRAAVQQDVRRVGGELAQRFPQTNESLTLTSMPLTEMLLGDVRTPLLVLLGAVGLVLLVACANVANLLLARATVREGEMAVRAAIGAGRARLVRQLLTESFVLAAIGAVLGLLLAYVGTRALIAAQPADIPRLGSIGIDRTVVAFAALIALLTGLLFGALPALQATGSRLMQSLREGGRGALPGGRGQRLRAALVVAELALAVMLLVGAGLLIRSFIGMTRVDTGFTTENAIAFRVSLQGSAYGEPERRRAFVDQLGDALRALPGVTEVGAASGLPMTDNVSLLGPFQVEGLDVPPNVLPEIRLITVTPGYFDAIGARLIAGRGLDARDRADAPLVALFNEAAIARWFPDGRPVGKRVLLGGTPREVVGIVSDVLQGAPGVPIEPEMYVPYGQRAAGTMRFVVRGRGDMGAIAAGARAAVRDLDPLLPIESIDPLSRVFSDAVARPRLYTTLLTLFAGVALVLAVIGIFGVMSYLVAQRAREISIRLALGAERSSVIGLVVGSAMKVAAAGLAAGIAGAAIATGVLRSQLYGVQRFDPVTLGAVLLILALSALLASAAPALRAARMDPGAALRDG
jgi:putative ABC transport system permease protein